MPVPNSPKNPFDQQSVSDFSRDRYGHAARSSKRAAHASGQAAHASRGGRRLVAILVHTVQVPLIMRTHLAIQARVRTAVLLRPRTVTPLRLRIGV